MKVSAGILLFRGLGSALEVLIAHPGGPYWARRDRGVWSIPKGELHAGEEPMAGALREFREETGHDVSARLIDLGTITQRSGKIVHGFGAEGDLDPKRLDSNRIEIAWPPRSRRTITIPEIDRVVWTNPAGSKERLVSGQGVFVDRLTVALGVSGEPLDHGE